MHSLYNAHTHVYTSKVEHVMFSLEEKHMLKFTELKMQTSTSLANEVLIYKTNN